MIPANNADTEYAPLHLVSTIADDHCKMLRFRDCQIENNRVSPYVWIDDAGPIGIWFDRIHAENAKASGQQDFLRSKGGDCHFAGIAAVGFREGFILEGYRTNAFSDCRNVISVVGPRNVVGSIRMSNVQWGRSHGPAWEADLTSTTAPSATSTSAGRQEDPPCLRRARWERCASTMRVRSTRGFDFITA